MAAVPNLNVNPEDGAYSCHGKDIQCLRFVTSLQLNKKSLQCQTQHSYSTEVLFFHTIPQPSDAFLPFSHEFQNSFAVEFGLFTHFYFCGIGDLSSVASGPKTNARFVFGHRRSHVCPVHCSLYYLRILMFLTWLGLSHRRFQESISLFFKVLKICKRNLETLDFMRFVWAGGSVNGSSWMVATERARFLLRRNVDTCAKIGKMRQCDWCWKIATVQWDKWCTFNVAMNHF